MKVKELIAELQRQNPEALVLASDRDQWYYALSTVNTRFVNDAGRETTSTDPNGELCVTIIVE